MGVWDWAAAFGWEWEWELGYETCEVRDAVEAVKGSLWYVYSMGLLAY